MNTKEALEQRHMVRKYTDEPIPADLVEKLNQRISQHNKKYGIELKLMTDNDKAISGIIKLIMAKGVKNYIILAGNDTPDLREKLGYCGADMMALAQMLGLNSWWIGGTFKRSVSRFVEGKKVIGIIPIGYGQTQGVPHKSKTAEDVSKYEGTAPEWFVSGIKTSLLAPTAINKQDYFITGKGDKVHIQCDKGTFSGENRGLIKYHFEVGAGKENFQWE